MLSGRGLKRRSEINVFHDFSTQKCGVVLNWKRVQGASGNLQAFGFCEYKEPEHTLRAIRLLHDLTLGEKNLLVSINKQVKVIFLSVTSFSNKPLSSKPLSLVNR